MARNAPKLAALSSVSMLREIAPHTLSLNQPALQRRSHSGNRSMFGMRPMTAKTHSTATGHAGFDPGPLLPVGRARVAPLPDTSRSEQPNGSFHPLGREPSRA